jgi:hypothetical protein
MPRDAQEVDENLSGIDGPLFCLLEDDALIAEVKITTERLLTDIGADEAKAHVHLLIRVRTDIVDMIKAMENWQP